MHVPPFDRQVPVGEQPDGLRIDAMLLDQDARFKRLGRIPF
jgi:hypothetical protein